MYTFDALQILIFLIPGFISSALLSKILGRNKSTNDLSQVVEALIFSLIIYVIYSIFFTSSPIRLDKEAMVIKVDNWLTFIPMLACSIVLPIVIGYMYNFDLAMRFLRRIKVTTETRGPDVWNDVFSEKYRMIIINFEDGRRLMGWAQYTSGTYEGRLIYIVYPSWVVGTDEIKSMRIREIDGLLITPEYKIKFIEFLTQPEGDGNDA